MTQNNFPVQLPSQNANAMAQTDQSRSIAEVQAALMIARMNPRDQRQAMDRILNACTRQNLARNAIYQYARGGTNISGASIRLAEAIAQQWGNIQFGIREIEQVNGGSTVQAFAWDVETNTRREVTFHVPHERRSGGTNKKLTDPRDIYELVANQGARRLRACILAIIPSDVTDSAVEQCEQTLIASADVSPDGVKRLVEAFADIGVSKEQIEVRIQRRLDAIQPAQVVNLRKIYTSIRDGMSSADEWFEPSKRTAIEADKPKSRNVDSLIGGESDAVTEVEVPKSAHQEESAQTMPIPELVLDNSGETAKSDDMSEPAKITPEYLNSHAEWRQKIMAWTSMSELTIGLNEMPKDIKADLKEFLKARQDFIKANNQ
jgi:hypothetical protein